MFRIKITIKKEGEDTCGWKIIYKMYKKVQVSAPRLLRNNIKSMSRNIHNETHFMTPSRKNVTFYTFS